MRPGHSAASRRWCLALSGTLAGVLGLSAAVLPAHALPTPLNPTDPAVADQWVNPAVRPGQAESSVTLDLVTLPSVDHGSADLGGDLFLQARLRNTSDETSPPLVLAARRSEAITTPEEIRPIMAADNPLYGYYGRVWELAPLQAGEERTLYLRVPLGAGIDGGLSISQPGIYPVMLALSSPQEELTTERFLLPVEGASAPEAEPALEPPAPPPGLTLLYPISAPIDIVPGETGTAPSEPPLLLRSENLAGELSEGGRLHELLRVYANATATDPALAEASCLALDPALVDTVARMAQGYEVSQQRQPIEQPRRLRDSWFQDNQDFSTTTGTGSEAAEAFLAQLTDLAATGCIVALPWAGTDLNAVAQTQDTWLVREAIERGPDTLATHLGHEGVTNTVIAPRGYITEDTLPSLLWADHEAGRLDPGGMSLAWENELAGAEPRAASGLPINVIVADNTVAGEAPNLALPGGIHAVTFPSPLGAVLGGVGKHPHTVGYSNPATRFDYRIDSAPARALTAGAALEATVSSATEPVLAPLPLTIDPESAEYLLAVASGVLAEASATPLPLLSRMALPAEPAAEGQVGSPYPDPSVVSDAEITRVHQQSQYIDDLTRLMDNDPSITLTRYGFTHPLRRELVGALRVGTRPSYRDHVTATERTGQALDAHRNSLQMMRASVTLIPPGNVYTRTSPSSPLLIVAQNGLPLPVTAELNYHSEDDVTLHTPSPLRIPAQGSITVEMTADLPSDDEATDLRVWLATVDGATISVPVDITVQTRANITALATVAVGLILALLVLLLVRQRRR